MQMTTRLIITALATFALLGTAAAQEVKQGSAAPDSDTRKPAPALSPEERERLINLTRVAITPALRPANEDATAEPSFDERDGLAREIEAADLLLGKLSTDSSSAASELMMKLLDAPEPGIRVTAMHWLGGRRDVAAESLARGINDRDATVRTVAENLLIERGISDETIAKVKAARSKGKENLMLEVRDALASLK